MKHALSPSAFKTLTGAGDDIVGRLEAYLDLLHKWNRRINLVGAESLVDPWRRHFLDSAQLIPLLPSGRPVVVDMGSGAGFPGLVLAIMTAAHVHLVESNTRKCAFLRETARRTGTSVDIHNERIENLAIDNVDVVTARACASLEKLLNFAAPLLSDTGFSIFLKGKSAETELTEARKTWKMRTTAISSLSGSHGLLLRISDIRPRHET